MFVTFNNFIGNKTCLKTRQVKQEGNHLYFSHNGSKIFVPIEDLISIQEVPDLPRIAFIPIFIWNETISNLLKDYQVIWHDEYLYCHQSDCQLIQKILFETGDSEIIISQLPIEEYYSSK